ncbi:hypothetical protein [Amycolatopsis sp. NPDC004378]
MIIRTGFTRLGSFADSAAFARPDDVGVGFFAGEVQQNVQRRPHELGKPHLHPVLAQDHAWLGPESGESSLDRVFDGERVLPDGDGDAHEVDVDPLALLVDQRGDEYQSETVSADVVT